MKIPTTRLRARLAPLLLLPALVSGACSQAQTSVPATSATPVTLTPCHLPGMGDAVQCGTLARPLNPQDPTGKQIDIHFAVVPSKARGKYPDPVYLLAGGPGQSAMTLMPQALTALQRLNNRRDLVFVDQRGTGQSAPLQCEPDTTLSMADAMDPEHFSARMAACRATLQALPYGDLRQFTTTIAMADLDAVRAALGQDRINLVGGSYGTRAALEYLRLYPQHVRRMVIDGVAPPDMSLPQSFAIDTNAALQSLFADCAADKACNQRYPRLQAQWESIFAKLPQTISLANPMTGVPERLTITGPTVASMVRGPLYAPRLAAGLPMAISEAAQGRWTAMVGLSSTLTSRSGLGLAMGMHFSVICAEDALKSASPHEAGQFANAFDKSYQTVCANWPKGAVDPAFYQIPTSTSPILILSGGIDPATPPRHATRAAKALGSKVEHAIVEKAGHGLMMLGCTSDIIFRFLDDKEPAGPKKPDLSCLTAIPRPTAFVPMAANLGAQP